jgi:NADPH:quinone reductase-like Zn-dependent oxidoreductase
MGASEPVNKAAYQPAKKALALDVRSAPYTQAPENCIVIKNHAVAINPIDWLVQQKGDIMYTHLNYPFVLGMDVAGEVVEVGKNVERFQEGDRVVGFCRGTDVKVNSSAQGGFQNYVVLQADLTSQIPRSMSYESASVIPLGLSTAAAGLFQDDQLGLQYPTVTNSPKPTGKTILIFGGSTSVGSNAIQLGVAAGYEVFTTSSPKNFDYLKKLGASQVFDYNSKSVVQDIITAFKGKKSAGAIAIGSGGAEACMSILKAIGGNKFVSLISFPVLREEPKHLAFLRTVYHFLSWIVSYKFKGLISGVKSNFVNAGTIAHNSVGKAMYEDFLPKALETGLFIPAPEPLVAGQGLESLQAAFDLQKKGVSAKKIVISI